MSILLLPSEILVDIFKDLSKSDLESVRLSHAAFGQTTGFLLFQSIKFDFGDGLRRKTSFGKGAEQDDRSMRITRGVCHLLKNDRGQVFSDVTKRIEVIFKPTEGNFQAFYQFASAYAGPFFELFRHVKELVLDVTNDRSHAKPSGSTVQKCRQGIDVFYRIISARLRDINGWVEELDARLSRRDVTYLEPARGLRSLSLSVWSGAVIVASPFACREKIVGEETMAMYRVIGRIMAKNLSSLKLLSLSYIKPDDDSWEFMVERYRKGVKREPMDIVLDNIRDNRALQLATLKLHRSGALPAEMRNLVKLQNIERLKGGFSDYAVRPSSITPEDSVRWVKLLGSGITLRKLGCEPSVSKEFIDYAVFAASQGTVQEFKIPCSRIYSQEYRLTLCNVIFPNIRQSLRRLTLFAHPVPIGDDLNIYSFELMCPMLTVTPTVRANYDQMGLRRRRPAMRNYNEQQSSESESFRELMHILRGSQRLENITIHIRNGAGHGEWLASLPRWKNTLCDRWREFSTLKPEEDWKQGLILIIKVNVANMYKEEQKAWRGEWKLQLDEDGFWRFKPVCEFDKCANAREKTEGP